MILEVKYDSKFKIGNENNIIHIKTIVQVYYLIFHEINLHEHRVFCRQNDEKKSLDLYHFNVLKIISTVLLFHIVHSFSGFLHILYVRFV